MPSAREILYIFFKKADLFQNNQLLRYNGNSEYTTVTGGIISTVLIIIYVVLFSSMGLKTLKREIITSYVYTEN